EVAHGDIATLRVELTELVEVDNLILDPERVLEATQFRSAHVQWHLATLESDPHLVTGLRSLGSATRGLTLGCFTTADARLGGLGAGGRTQVVHLQHLRTCLDLGLGSLLGRGLGGSRLGRSLGVSR